MTLKNDDFAPLPTYSESTTSNQSWVQTTLTKTESSGTTHQVLIIIPKK